jgi:ABC-type transport system involved in cytochrome bd biosynthesis fused ATPase/permease subunit
MLNYSVQSGTSGDSLIEEKIDESILGFNPFPGLRPFSIEDAHLFFGREGQVDEILLKLNKSRSVTVIGYSGSGKSSLMYCGLIPVLYGGFMTETGPHWKVIVTRPGNSPIENLNKGRRQTGTQSNHWFSAAKW